MSDFVSKAARTADVIERGQRRGLNAVISYDRDKLLAQARELDGHPSNGTLRGLILGVKDNICTLEYKTTCGSNILRDYESPYEATAVSRLRNAGALIACKSNLDEFAMGSSTEHSAFGRTRHPIEPERVPGGSSGGSAALVADGAVEAALGSETGGSVRQPAAFCGVVGIKPTYGRVSRYGLVAFGSSLDQIGVLAKSVRTAADVLSVISGTDPFDSTCADRPPLTLDDGADDLTGMTVGLPTEYYSDDVDSAVRAGCERAIHILRESGAEVTDVSLPHSQLAIPAYYVIAPAEASANLARYDGARYGTRVMPADGDVHALFRATRGAGFGPEVRRRIIVGTYVLSAGYYEAFYGKAQLARGLIAKDFDNLFRSGVDLLFTPTTPTTAFKSGEKIKDPVAMYLSDVFVCPCNLAGIPGLSLPVGRSNGLPIGGQLIAAPFDEARMIRAAAIIEREIDATDEVQ